MRKPLRKAIIRAASVAVLTAAVASCSSPTVQVLFGNYRQSKGEYARATINYFRAAEGGQHQAVIRYDLANVYRSLGEIDAAAASLESAFEEARGRELRFRSAFNLGCISFQENDFQGAVRHFTEALRIEPNDWDAKINLELSLEKLQGGPGTPKPFEEPRAEPLEDPYREVLDFVREREEMIWGAADTQGTASADRDW